MVVLRGEVYLWGISATRTRSRLRFFQSNHQIQPNQIYSRTSSFHSANDLDCSIIGVYFQTDFKYRWTPSGNFELGRRASSSRYAAYNRLTPIPTA